MDPNTGNPSTGGGNPYLKPPQPQTPVAGGEMDAGMAPLGGGGTSETTKPRQMPAGSAPDPMAAPGQSLGPGGAGAPPPLAPPPGSNTPQPTKPPVTAQMRVQAIRQDILANNPGLPPAQAHAIALSVVALQAEASSPMGPAPNYSQQQRIIDPRHVPTNQGSGASQGGNNNLGDLNDATNPYSPLHPNHPLYRQYGGSPGIHADPLAKPGDFQTQFGGRNRLEDHAYSKGYRGQTPHLYAATDMLANHLVDKARTWRQNRKQQPPATRQGKPGAPGARVMP